MSTASLRLFVWCLTATHLVHDRLETARRDDRGEVTATTALIVLLVVAAIAAGGIIAAKLIDNANNVPSP
jgi:hypothetical protein